jgi:hypothetical protein
METIEIAIEMVTGVAEQYRPQQQRQHPTVVVFQMLQVPQWEVDLVVLAVLPIEGHQVPRKHQCLLIDKRR